jgi:hypothetical protein
VLIALGLPPRHSAPVYAVNHRELRFSLRLADKTVTKIMIMCGVVWTKSRWTGLMAG